MSWLQRWLVPHREAERTRLEGSLCDVSMAHSLFFAYLFFTNSGWYRLGLFEAQDVRVFGVLIIQSHVNPCVRILEA